MAIAWLLLTGSSCALAHAHLTHSSPADGEALPLAPHALELRFSEAAQLTALWIQKAGEPRQKLGPYPTQSQEHLRVGLPPLTPGKYVVSWRALSADGHVAEGQLHFTID